MNKKVIIGLVVVVLAVGVYVMSKNKSAPYAPQASDTEEVKTFAIISGNDFSFTPSTLTVKKDETKKVVFTNTGKYPHNFVIDELGVKSATINFGDTTEVTFTANKVGSFPFYCGVGTHREKGMVGTLTVEE
jgi:plastocyanin